MGKIRGYRTMQRLYVKSVNSSEKLSPEEISLYERVRNIILESDGLEAVIDYPETIGVKK